MTHLSVTRIRTTTGSIKSPAAGASTNNDTSSSLGVMEIVMIIVLILLLVIVILLVIFLIVCWKRQNKKNKVVPEATKTTQTGSQYNDHEIPRTSLKDVRPAAVVPNGYNDSSVHYYTEKTGSQDGLVPEKRKSKKKKKKKQSEPEYDQPISYIVPEVRAAREPSQSASLRPSQSASLRPDPYYEELSSERETFRTPSPQPYRPVRRPKHGESVPSGYSPRAPRDAQHHRSFSTKEPELMTYRSSYDADDADEYEPVYAQLEPPHNNGRGSSAPDPTY